MSDAPKKTVEELRDLLKDAPKPYTLWRHYKGGRYVVHCCAIREHDQAPCVVYKEAGLHAHAVGPPPFVRPLSDWYEVVSDGGTSVPRFSPIDTPRQEDSS